MPLPPEPLCSSHVEGVDVVVVVSDITKLDVDAVVNPANSLMIMGGGVAGAIKRVGGEEIEVEARRYAPVPVGQAIVTSGGKLRAKYVIHAPTMERPAQRIGSENVYLATRAALEKAVEIGISTIAIPGMGTGVGGVPYRVAAKEMIRALKEVLSKGKGKLSKVFLVAIDPKLAETFCRELEPETK